MELVDSSITETLRIRELDSDMAGWEDGKATQREAVRLDNTMPERLM
jgi:hypothetical protein